MVRSPSGRWIGDAALDSRHQQVLEPDIGEGAAHHDLVIAAPRAVGVEVARLHAMSDQILARPGLSAAMIRPARCDRW